MRTKKNGFVPYLERLEDRLVLDSYLWRPATGLGSANFTDFKQWFDQTLNRTATHAPTFGDDVSFDSNSGAATCVVSAHASDICRTISDSGWTGSLEVDGNLTVQAGSNLETWDTGFIETAAGNSGTLSLNGGHPDLQADQHQPHRIGDPDRLRLQRGRREV